MNNIKKIYMKYKVQANTVMLLLLIFGIMGISVAVNKQLVLAKDNWRNSYLLVDEVRQNAEDLTRMSKLYVQTGDVKYKGYYKKIIDIRNGMSPRPVNYNNSMFWDLVLLNIADYSYLDKNKSLLELMKEAGFTNEELIVMSNDRYDFLGKVEKKAMELVSVGGIQGESNRALSNRLLNSSEYMASKLSVMKSINDFNRLVEERTTSEVVFAKWLSIVIQISLFMSVLGGVILLWLSYKKLYKTLGGGVEDVYYHISKIGYGDIESEIKLRDGDKTSVLSHLSEMQSLMRDNLSKSIQHELEKERTEKKFSTFYELDLVGLAIISPTRQWLNTNKCLCKMLEYTEDELRLLSSMDITYVADRDIEDVNYVKILSGEIDGYGIEKRFSSKTGKILTVKMVIKCIRDVNGNVDYMLAMIEDITARKTAEAQLRISAATFETHEAIMITDANAIIIKTNKAFEKITGYKDSEVVGKNPSMFNSDIHSADFYKKMRSVLLLDGFWCGEMWDVHKTGRVYPKQMTITAVKDSCGKTVQYVSIFADITERKKADSEIYNLAFHDSLTGLANRRNLLEKIGLSIKETVRTNKYSSLIFIDMDEFKNINDTLGHIAGDSLLIEVSNRLKSCVELNGLVARMGGDEFVVMVEGVGETVSDVMLSMSIFAEKVRELLSLPYLICGNVQVSSPSIGVCIYKGAEEIAEDLIKRADMAMYVSKESGKNRVTFFDVVMQEDIENHVSLSNDLKVAISDNQLQLYYQVQVNSDGKPIGAEALIRWIHPRRGFVSPDKFIYVAEEGSLIIDIGNWVLDAACKQLVLWSKNENTKHLVLAINVSSMQFVQPDFVSIVSDAIKKYNVDSSKLKLELTESVMVKDLDVIIKKMLLLKNEVGVSLSLDDFGTGYSSLSYLNKLPVSQIKIDQSFIRQIGDGFGSDMLIKTIIDLSHNFNFAVIAEGVESSVQMDFLRENGCLNYQGYLFSEPVSIEKFEKLFVSKL